MAWVFSFFWDWRGGPDSLRHPGLAQVKLDTGAPPQTQHRLPLDDPESGNREFLQTLLDAAR